MNAKNKNQSQLLSERDMQQQDVTHDRQIEDSSEPFVSSLLDATGQAIIAMDLGGKITFCNRNAEKLLRRQKENILGIELTRFLIQSFHKHVDIFIEKALEGESWSGEMVMRYTDFTPFTIRIKSNPLRNINGDVTGIVTTCFHINHLETNDYLLIEKERLLTAYHHIGLNIMSSLNQDEILDNLAHQIMDAGLFRSLMISLVKEEENVLEIVRSIWRNQPLIKSKTQLRLDDLNNHPCLAVKHKEIQIFGFIEDQPFTSLLYPQNRNKIGFFIPVMQKERVVAVLGTACAPDQQEEILHRITVMRPLLDQVAVALEHAKLYTSVQLRIAEREQAEKTLRENEERYRLLVENAPVCIHEIDLQGCLISMNQAGLKMIGVENESDILGLSYFSVIAKDDRDRVEMLFKQACQGQSAHFQFKTKDIDHPLLFESSFIPIQNSNGQVIKLMGVTQNITERKRLEDELRRVQNLDALGILAGGIAHDFNNVLTGVLGNLALLEMGIDKNSVNYEFALEAKKAANKTRGLTQQLMTFSKGGLPVKENASLIELITETTTLCLSGANTKPQYHWPPDLYTVEIDKGQIGQVIQNLVINADQAMPEGGLLKLSANNIEIAADNMMGLSAGKYVKVVIQDQGIGIPVSILNKIFNPYFTTKEAGHGLGLAISYSIINKHGGYITAYSEPNMGSTFEFYLPASKEKNISNIPKRQTLIQGTGRILLMDDDETVRRSLNRMLDALGYEVDEVQDGEEAFSTYQASRDAGKPYDVVIMDLTIPGGLGGKEAVRKLKALDPKACVIVSSGYSHDPVMAHYQEHGFDAMIKKPIALEDLSMALQSVLHK